MKEVDKVYISLPMTGYEDTVKERYEKACNHLKSIYDKYYPGVKLEIVAPGNIDDFTEEGYIGENRNNWEWFIGEDVKVLLSCNAIYMTDGWKKSKGCRIELAVASQHCKKIFGLQNNGIEIVYDSKFNHGEEFANGLETGIYNQNSIKTGTNAYKYFL